MSIIEINGKRLTKLEKSDWIKLQSLRRIFKYFQFDQQNIQSATQSYVELQMKKFSQKSQKVELEAIDEMGQNFLTRVYIPRKLDLWYQQNAKYLFM